MDVRQRRTREKLFTAVLALATERAPEEISVTELAEEAGVHRSTLYEHASSPVTLLQDALLSELDVLRGALVGTSADDVARVVDEVTRGVLDHVLQHAAIYRRGLGEDSGAASLHAMLSGHFRTSSRLLRQVSDIEVEVPGIDPAVVADQATRFIAEGTVGLIEGWLLGPDPAVETFMRTYVRLLPGWWPHDG